MKKKQVGVSGRSKHLPLGVVDIAKHFCVKSGASGVSRAGTPLGWDGAGIGGQAGIAVQ